MLLNLLRNLISINNYRDLSERAHKVHEVVASNPGLTPTQIRRKIPGYTRGEVGATLNWLERNKYLQGNVFTQQRRSGKGERLNITYVTLRPIV